MKKSSVGLGVLGVLAVLGMGITMPSCPGQQALQEQIDRLQSGNTQLTQRAQALDTEVKLLRTDMNQANQLLAQMAQTIQAQKTALDQLNASFKDFQTKLTSKSSRKRSRRRGQ